MIYCWVLDVDTVESISAEPQLLCLKQLPGISKKIIPLDLSISMTASSFLLLQSTVIVLDPDGNFLFILLLNVSQFPTVSTMHMSCVRSWSLLRIKSSISSPLIFPRSSGSKVCSWSPSQGYFGILIRWGNNISLYPIFGTRYYHQLSFCEGIFH